MTYLSLKYTIFSFNDFLETDLYKSLSGLMILKTILESNKYKYSIDQYIRTIK